MGLERADVAARYERYLTRCNEHLFDQLGEFVDEQVSGSGSEDGLAAYIDRRVDAFAGKPRSEIETFIDACPQADE